MILATWSKNDIFFPQMKVACPNSSSVYVLKYKKGYLIGTVNQVPKQPLRILDRSQSIILPNKQVNWDVDVTNVISGRSVGPVAF